MPLGKTPLMPASLVERRISYPASSSSARSRISGASLLPIRHFGNSNNSVGRPKVHIGKSPTPEWVLDLPPRREPCEKQNDGKLKGSTFHGAVISRPGRRVGVDESEGAVRRGGKRVGGDSGPGDRWVEVSRALHVVLVGGYAGESMEAVESGTATDLAILPMRARAR